MIVLDGTIVGVALPAIIADLHLDLTDAQWINSMYAVVFAALLLTSGRLGDRLGRRRLFLTGVTLFALASVAAGLAGTATALIAGRALQGVGGAMVLPATLSTVNATFRGPERATAFGIWGAVMAGMAAVGPLLGGWLTTQVTWRWIFFVNVPVAVLVVSLGVWAVVETREPDRRPGADVDGLLTSAIGFGLVVFGLIEGSSAGWWRPTRAFSVGPWTWSADAPLSIAASALIAGSVFVMLFIVWERHRAGNGRSALLDVGLFRIAPFAWGNVTAMAVAVGEFALVFVLPLVLVNAMGLSIMQAGVVLSGMAAGAFLAGASARHVAARLGAPQVVLWGLALEVSGTAGCAVLVAASASPWWVGAALVWYGVGLGLASAQLTSTVLADVPARLSGAASATQSTVRQVGAALGSALAGAMLAARVDEAVSQRLSAIPQLPDSVAAALVKGTGDSGGGMISALRAQGVHGRLGDVGPQVVSALSEGFAQAGAAAIWVACACLALGLVGAVQVVRASRRTAC
ncbi:Riboflavin transporter RibZ [Austwickia sp. TVS 96-490-7B]|nr:Riboflavin transporter RibZ [Austwickia sp. TVS 96-490-7B]